MRNIFCSRMPPGLAVATAFHRMGENKMTQRNIHFIWRGIALLALLLARSAWADCCYSDKSDIKHELHVNAPFGAGNITTGADVPIGTVIYTQNFNPSFRNVFVTCDTPQTFVSWNMDFETPPHPLSAWSSATFKRVYETGLPGVGVFIDNHALDNYLLPYITNGTYVEEESGWSSNLFKYRIRLIKIGDIQPGVVTGADLPCLMTRVGPTAAPFTAMRLCFTGAINVEAKTCTTPDVFVAMGKYDMGRYFTGKGSVTEWKDASVRLLDCPKFHGTVEAQYSNNGTGSISGATNNSLTLSLTPNTAVIDDGNGIMGLKDGSGSASGVGIQLAYGTSSPRPVQFSREINVPLSPATPTAFTIPLQARYIQTEPRVTPGVADATVTFNINYY
ncbi:fimbrial protein [Serratia marcescens]|uniref:fimbrial protein n=1 Tax=Serratia marcescens TaxID=615 RepID=UPI0011E77231|nr:fimbrial protein [Serratia marcescens]